jgi:sulfite reductase (NADPH) flavoprotein alpha-component
MQAIPQIPDSAPFTPQQRGWLNGFLAGLLSGASQSAMQPRVATSALHVAVLYASQSGTGEGLARKIAKELKANGHTAVLNSLEAYSPAKLAEQRHAVLIASTYGEGEPPDCAKQFFQQLCLTDAPKLSSLTYSVFALGDRHYEQFCKFGADLDDRIASLGAQRLMPRMECDVDVEEPFACWKSELITGLDRLTNGNKPPAPVSPLSVAVSAPEPKPASGARYSREKPFHAPLKERRTLTHAGSSKQTIHLSFCLQAAEVEYQAGDALAVLACNDPALVDEILEAAKLTGSESVSLTKLGEMSLRETLNHHLQFTHIHRKLVETFASRSSSSVLRCLLLPEQQEHLEEFCYGRGLIDLLHEYPDVVTGADDLVHMLPRLAPRLYSISSSPAAHFRQVHTTVAVVRYRSHNREREGVCSTWLADRVHPGETLPVYIQPNKRFRLPQDGGAPMIMIGPGTGIAPFRGFLHERRALGCRGRNWLFFGERSAKSDYLYRDELQEMFDQGHLTRLDLAFSRDQAHKIYVQDRMRENSHDFWRWLEDGASVYVCGDAKYMAKDVDSALHEIVEQEGHMTRNAATEYVQQLKDENRYLRDVY